MPLFGSRRQAQIETGIVDRDEEVGFAGIEQLFTGLHELSKVADPLGHLPESGDSEVFHVGDGA